MDLKLFVEIDKKTKLLIHGYIRLIQQLFPKHIPYYNIPIFINHICGIYLYQSEKWNEKQKGDSYIIDNDKKIITQNGYTGSAFLSHVVSDGKHEWKFKLINYKSGNVGIGIVKHGVDKRMDYYLGQEANTAYVYLVNSRTLNDHDGDVWMKEYGDKICEQNDIITIHLDLTKLTLSFSLNDKNYGKAFDVDQCKYIAAVDLSKKGTQIQLLSYETSIK